jgi:hypothetical protein
MRSRLPPVVLAVAILTASSYLGWRWIRPSHRITPSTFARIHAGMTRKEVQASFGVPPGDYDAGTNRMTVLTSPDTYPPGWRSESWRAPETLVVIHFDQDGKVLGKAMGNNQLPSWFDCIRRLLSR